MTSPHFSASAAPKEPCDASEELGCNTFCSCESFEHRCKDAGLFASSRIIQSSCNDLSHCKSQQQQRNLQEASMLEEEGEESNSSASTEA